MHGNLESVREWQHGDAPVTVWLGEPQAARFFDVGTLDADERARFLTRRNSQRRREFAVSRALRAHARTARLPAESLSHSGGCAALLQAPVGTLAGVDLEVHRPRDFMRIARNTFAEPEIALLKKLPDPTREQMFYVFWTLKEAFAKALSINLLDALRLCECDVDTRTVRGPTSLAGCFSVFQPRLAMTLAVVCIGTADATEIRTLHWPASDGDRWPLLTAGAVVPSAALALPAAAP